MLISKLQLANSKNLLLCLVLHLIFWSLKIKHKLFHSNSAFLQLQALCGMSTYDLILSGFQGEGDPQG